MSMAAKLIITNGLGAPACCGMIVTKFTLAGCICKVTKVQGITGGSVPLRPGQIKNFYQPVPEQPHLIPVDQLNPSKYLKVTVKFHEKVNEKEFLVPEKSLKGQLIIKLVKFVEVQSKTISAMVKRFQSSTKNFSLKIKSFIRRDK